MRALPRGCPYLPRPRPCGPDRLPLTAGVSAFVPAGSDEAAEEHTRGEGKVGVAPASEVREDLGLLERTSPPIQLPSGHVFMVKE